MPTVGYILVGLLAYLLGSIPTGFLVGKARGVDIRMVGSGNIGATNVLRSLGKPAGAFVMMADALKGWLAVAVMARLVGHWSYPGASAQASEWFKIEAGLAAVLGHNYTCWLSFKGGKGIATSAGVLLALVPWSLLIILGVWLLVLGFTHYVSAASICASLSLPFAAWVTGESSTMLICTSAMTAVAVYRHKANIKRLLQGKENRFVLKKSPEPVTPKHTS